MISEMVKVSLVSTSLSTPKKLSREEVPHERGGVFRLREDIVVGHGIVVRSVDGDGDRGGIAAEVAVADGVGEGGAGGFSVAEAFEIAIRAEGKVAGIDVGEGGGRRRRRD